MVQKKSLQEINRALDDHSESQQRNPPPEPQGFEEKRYLTHVEAEVIVQRLTRGTGEYFCCGCGILSHCKKLRVFDEEKLPRKDPSGHVSGESWQQETASGLRHQRTTRQPLMQSLSTSLTVDTAGNYHLREVGIRIVYADAEIRLCPRCAIDFTKEVSRRADCRAPVQLHRRPASSWPALCQKYDLLHLPIKAAVEANAKWLRDCAAARLILQVSKEGFRFASGALLSEPNASILLRRIQETRVSSNTESSLTLGVEGAFSQKYVNSVKADFVAKRLAREHRDQLQCLAKEELYRLSAWPLYDQIEIEIVVPRGGTLPKHTTVDEWLMTEHLQDEPAELIDAFLLRCREGDSDFLLKAARLVQLNSETNNWLLEWERTAARSPTDTAAGACKHAT